MKLFRIFIALFALASVLNLALPPTANAAAAPTLPSTILIGMCKDRGPFATGTPCAEYMTCLSGKLDTPNCPSIKPYDNVVPALGNAGVYACRNKSKKSEVECGKAYGTCVFNRFKDNKLDGGDANTCKDLVQKGELAKAMEPVETKDGKDDKKCVIDGIGWLLCPVMGFMGLVVDGAYALVSTLLTVQPLMTPANGGNDTTGAYTAWSVMRNFANVAFVIVFLVIIMSQVSSIGISNYGIKKMLPRLIVAAVLVNISYWICALAIDVSNILGASIGDVFKAIEKSLPPPDSGTFSGANKWANIVGGVLAGAIAGAAIAAIALYATLSTLVVVLLPVLLAIITTFLVLILRQALIILLVVIAPLAFVAYLLPNTESLFKKWRATFQTLLMLYPIIALIFGASGIASNIIMASAEGSNKAYTIAIQIMGAAVSVLPLALTPIIMKFSGGILNRFGGIVNNPNKGPYDRLRNRAKGWNDYRKDVNKGRRLRRAQGILTGEGRHLGGQDSRRRRIMASIGSGGATNAVNTAQKRGFAKGLGDESAQQYFAERALRDDGFAAKMSGGGELKTAGLQASAQAAVDKILKQDVANREIMFQADVEFKRDPQAAFEKAMREGDKIGALAAQNILFKSGSGGVSRFRDAMNATEGAADPSIVEALKTNVREQHGKYAKEKGADVVKWASNPDATLANTTSGPLSDAELVGQHSASMAKMAQNGEISAEQAKKILNDDRLNANLDPGKKAVLQQVEAEGTYQENIQHTQQREQNEAYDTYAPNRQATQQREQNEAYETYRDNIRP